MKAKELIALLLANPDLEILIEANDGDIPFSLLSAEIDGKDVDKAILLRPSF